MSSWDKKLNSEPDDDGRFASSPNSTNAVVVCFYVNLEKFCRIVYRQKEITNDKCFSVGLIVSLL